MHRFITIFVVAVGLLSVPPVLFALENPKEELKELGIEATPGSQVDLSTVFTASTGEKLTLSELTSGGRPLILVPVYFDCPRLCGMISEAIVELLNGLKLTLGADFQIASISFDSTETTQLAQKRAVKYRGQLKEPHDSNGWHFLVGSTESIDTVMKQIGFKYREDRGEFVHAAAIFVLTPDGRISQYFSGLQFSPFDVKLSLVEASAGKIGSFIDHALLFCLRFDPSAGKYTWAVLGLLRIVGIVTLIGLFGLIARLYLRERAENFTS